jgi:hypothetical protein
LQNNKQYVGQTVTHRKNNNKYRPFGYKGRLNDHISEAINNTKDKQCTYLNNAIRKYGKDKFVVELIITCSLKDADKTESEYIEKCNTFYPNGYNLTKGGKTTEHIKIERNDNLQDSKSRGRGFGYKHKEETKAKISARLSTPKEKQLRKNRMSECMIDHYDNKKVDMLSKMDIDEDFKKYINPVKNKDTGEVHDYVIRINGHKLRIASSGLSSDEKYDRLKNVLKKAYEKSKKVKADEM